MRANHCAMYLLENVNTLTVTASLAASLAREFSFYALSLQRLWAFVLGLDQVL